MTGERKAHEVTTSLVKAPLEEVDGGAEVVLKVKVGCSSACDLWGGTIRIVSPDGTLAKEVVLVSFDGTTSETNEFVVRAPLEPGEHTWKAVFPSQFGEGILHQESSTDIAICVKPRVKAMRI